MEFNNRIRKYLQAARPQSPSLKRQDIFWEKARNRNTVHSLHILAEREKIYDLFCELIALAPKEVLPVTMISHHEGDDQKQKFRHWGKEKGILLSDLDDHQDVLTNDPCTIAIIGDMQRWVSLYADKTINVFSKTDLKKEYELLQQREIRRVQKEKEVKIWEPPNYNIFEYQKKFQQMVMNLNLEE